MAVGADTQTPTAIQSAINSPSWLDPATDSRLKRLRQPTVSGLSHQQLSHATPTAYRVWPQPPTAAIGHRHQPDPALHTGTTWGDQPDTLVGPPPLIFPTFCPRFMRNQGVFRGARAKTRKPENRWKYNENPPFLAGSEKVEPRGIEPRSGDRTLVLLRA